MLGTPDRIVSGQDRMFCETEGMVWFIKAIFSVLQSMVFGTDARFFEAESMPFRPRPEFLHCLNRSSESQWTLTRPCG